MLQGGRGVAVAARPGPRQPSSIFQTHLGLARTIQHATRAVEHAVAPVDKIAAAVSHSKLDAHSPTPDAARTLDLRSRLEAGVPLRQQRQVSDANTILAQHAAARFASQGRRALQEDAKAKAEGASPLNLGFINLTPAAVSLAHLSTGIPGLAGQLVNEGLDLPAQSFLSGAQLGSASRKALEGNPQPLGQIGGQVLQQLEHPVKSFEQAPLSTALLFAGGENVLGRLGGGIARKGLLGDRAAELASTERPALKLYGDLEKRQSYNSDPLRKAFQVGYEKSLPHLPGRLAQADPFQATGPRLNRNMVGGLVHPGRADYMVAAVERVRRTFVNTIKDSALKLAPKHGRDAVPLIYQGIIRTPETAIEDLHKELGKLEAAKGDLKGPQLKANRLNAKRVEGLLADTHFHEDMAPAFHAAHTLQRVARPLEAILVHGGILAPDQLRAKLFPYAQAHMGATYDGERLTGPDGKLLTDEAIKAHMAENGVNDVGFMSHKAGIDGSSSYYQATSRLPGVERHARTGSAFANGTADHSWEALVGSLASKASKAAQLEGRTHELNQLAMVPKDGGFANRDAATRFARSSDVGPNGEQLPNGLGDLVPVHLGPQEVLDRGNVDPAELDATLHRFGLHNERSLVSEAAGKFGLIPKAVNARIAEHEAAIGARTNFGKGAQAYATAFRKAKLNTSTRHVLGVAQEQGIRLAAENLLPAHTFGSGPVADRLRISGKTVGGRAGRVGAKVDQQLKAAAEVDHAGHLLDEAGPLGGPIRMLEAQLGSRGGQVQGYKDMQAMRAGRTWSDTSLSGRFMQRADGAAQSTAGKAALAPWHLLQHGIEGNLAKVETATHHAMLGKALKKTGFIDSYRQVLKMEDSAVRDFVTKGLTPDKADELARHIDDMMGNWTHLTPTVRKLVGSVTPFGLWWLNSMRWLYRLPVTHPVKTGIAAAVYHATQQTRNAEGQGLGAKSPVPDFLQGGIPTTLPGLGKGHVNPSYYSPAGTLGPEAIQTALSLFVPQYSGPALRGLGLDPLTLKEQTDAKGKPLTVGQKLGNVAGEAAAGPVPGATQAEQLLTGGGKRLGTSNLLTDLFSELGGPAQVKPGTSRPTLQVLEKMLAPVRFAYDTGGHGAGSGPTALPALSPREQHRVEAARSSSASSGSLPPLTPRQEARVKRARERAAR